MIYKQILTPDEKNHSIEMPQEFFGKKVEVIVMELSESVKGSSTLPAGKKTSLDELFADFGANPDFPDIDQIRNKAWPSQW